MAVKLKDEERDAYLLRAWEKSMRHAAAKEHAVVLRETVCRAKQVQH